jgi:hypothetical protein
MPLRAMSILRDTIRTRHRAAELEETGVVIVPRVFARSEVRCP